MSALLASLPWVLIVAGLLFAKHRQDERWLAQVERLCQRIQAPDVAIAMHAETESPTDDDPAEDPTFTNIP